VLVGSDLFNQPPYQSFIVFGNGGSLLFKEGSHISDPLLDFILASAVHLGFLLLFSQGVNFVRNIFIIGFGAGEFDKFCLELS